MENNHIKNTKLENKQVSRLGGKGTCRRKKKRVNKTRTSNRDSEFKKNIANTNKKILALNKTNYVKLRQFIDELALDYMKDLKRDYINKSSGLRYSEINLEGVTFIYKNIFYPVDETKMLIKSDTYQFITNSFKQEGQNLFFKFIQSIDDIMVKKEYDINLDSDKYVKDDFNRSLEFFNINSNNKIHFSEIRQKYREFMNNTTKTEEQLKYSNIHFTLLRSQYNEYLKSI